VCPESESGYRSIRVELWRRRRLGWLAGMPVEMVVRLGAVRKPFLHFPLHLIFVFIPRQTNEEGPSIHSRFPDAPSNGAGHAQTPTRIVPPRQPRPSLHFDNDKKSRWCWSKKTTTTPLLSHWDSLSFTSQPRKKKLRDALKQRAAGLQLLTQTCTRLICGYREQIN
jgi:hypothetical protein